MRSLCRQRSRQRRKRKREAICTGTTGTCKPRIPWDLFPPAPPCFSISFDLQAENSVHRSNTVAFCVNNAVLQRAVLLFLLKSKEKTRLKGLASQVQTHTPRLVLHQVRKHDGPAAMPWRAEWDYKPGPALCMEKQQADCQDPSLNTFQSGLLWGVWALWSQLPTSTSVGSSLEAGTHSPNNPGFDPHSCCAVNLSGISAGERGHMDSPWDRNLIYPQKFPCGQQHCKIHFTCMCQSHVCFSPAQNN